MSITKNSKSMRHSVLCAIIAHGLQKYDVFLYGFFIPILSPHFFPDNANIAPIAVFGTFAAGYFARPLGALFFGHLGDKYGRKKAFMLSVLFVIIPTLIVGLLPDFNQIGLWAPIALVLCRLIQGFAAGGEFSGALIYVAEHLPDNQQGLAGSIVRSVGFFGVSIGTAIGYFMLLPSMPSYAWRFPFLLGALASLLSLFLRNKMTETPEFQEKNSKDLEVKQYPFIKTLKEAKLNMLCNIGISGAAYIFLYFTTVYIGTLYKQEGLLNTSQTMLINTLILFLWAALTPIAGIFADRFGLKRTLNFVLLFTILILPPVFQFYYLNMTFKNLFIFQLTLTILGSAYFGPAPGLIKDLFHTKYRFSGLSFSNTIAQASIGSSTPAIITALVTLTGHPEIALFWLLFGCGIALLGINKMQNLKIQPIVQAYGTT